MSDKLKPLWGGGMSGWKDCPYCESQAIVRREESKENREYAFIPMMLECQRCRARGPVGMNWQEAINFWNKRSKKADG